MTEVGADQGISPSDLPLKSHERLFFERVPLPPPMRERIELANGFDYAGLAEGVEAWGFRADAGAARVHRPASRSPRTGSSEEYEPVTEMLREAGLCGRGTETEAYARVVSLRYLLLRTHDWDDEVIERLREELDRPPRDEDTFVHRLRQRPDLSALSRRDAGPTPGRTGAASWRRPRARPPRRG